MKNEYVINDDGTVTIYANGYHYKNWEITIDIEDLEYIDTVCDGRWYVGVSKGTIYARFCKQIDNERTYFLMHREVMKNIVGDDIPFDMVVDHFVTHYGLDNRRCNLRLVTPEVNMGNKLTMSIYNQRYKK